MKRPAKPPTIQALLHLLDEVSVRIVSRARLQVDGGELQDFKGYYDWQNKTIVIGKARHRGQFEDMVATGIHELLHAFFDVRLEDERHHEDDVGRWEMRYFRSRALREAMGIRVANAAIFKRETA